MKKTITILSLTLLLGFLIFPAFSFAEETTDLSTSGGGLTAACPEGGCGFKELVDVVNKVINYVLFVLAIPIAAIMFAYAGILLITSGGEPSKRTKAKSIFVNVGIGLVVAAAAWLIINTILSIVGFDGSWIGFK
ncbi:MAG TPA: pilin [Candidatus Paceibacterota bacterium]|nr:pilin [Candidatus Paceibacterota bacterium]HPT18191.1 pilin [Candidatus Paceibacterota bacterium]